MRNAIAADGAAAQHGTVTQQPCLDLEAERKVVGLLVELDVGLEVGGREFEAELSVAARVPHDVEDLLRCRFPQDYLREIEQTPAPRCEDFVLVDDVISARPATF